jgi:hypothetical protein
MPSAYDFVSLKKDTDGKHKWVATIRSKTTGREKRVRFGAVGYDDYTMTGDEERKKAYLQRHAKNENWNDISTAGAWSKNLLWNKKSIAASLADIKRKFF